MFSFVNYNCATNSVSFRVVIKGHVYRDKKKSVVEVISEIHHTLLSCAILNDFAGGTKLSNTVNITMILMQF